MALGLFGKGQATKTNVRNNAKSNGKAKAPRTTPAYNRLKKLVEEKASVFPDGQEVLWALASWEDKAFQALEKNEVKDALDAVDLVNFLLTLSNDEFVAEVVAEFSGLPLLGPEEIKSLEVDEEACRQIGWFRLADKFFCYVRTPEGEQAVVAAHPYLPGKSDRIYIAPKRRVLELIDPYLVNRISGGAELNPKRVDEFFRNVLLLAIRMGSSDVHVEFYPQLGVSEIKVRKDGFLHTLIKIPNRGEWHLSFANYIFMRAQIDVGVYHRIYDRQIEVELFRRTYALRLSVLPVLYREQAYPQFCFRIMVSEDTGLRSLDALGFYPDDIRTLLRMIKAPYGIIYLCGPTGSGKNTTLYAVLDALLNESPVKVLSIEDPVEKRLTPGKKVGSSIVQVEVDKAKDITFVTALRAFLRHDPDVIFIGETRDVETAQAALHAAITGHLVFSTIHTNTAFDVVPRLISTLQVERDLLVSSLQGVVAQRLIRKVCSCATRLPFGELGDYLRSVPEDASLGYFWRGGLWEDFKEIVPPDQEVVVPVGCPECNGLGYRGRTLLYEILTVSHANRTHIFYEPDMVRAYLDDSFSKPMAVTGLRIIKDCKTTLEEVARFVNVREVKIFLEKTQNGQAA